jgi:multiple sugar transport system substrate-binding protein
MKGIKVMEEIELSLMNSDGYEPEVEIRPLLGQFESEHHCRVRVRMIPWETGRQELINIALYGNGPDVSEIGTSWCSSFSSMEALRPFSPRELTSMGGISAFFPSAWRSGQLFREDRMIAIPWLASVRVLYYRRDLLEKASVDEKTAFQSCSKLIEALNRLKASGIAVPLVLPTRNTIIPLLHSLASWVWAAGGDFVSKDGTHTLFNQPETRAGIRAFLELSQFLSPEARGLDLSQAEMLFWRGEAAISLSLQTPPILATITKIADPNMIANLGVASMPGGIPFIGGSNLVVWRHIAPSHEDLAIKLVRFLTGQQVQSTYNTKINYFPTRLDVMQSPPFSTDAFHQILMDGLNSGRSFPAITRWSIVEDRLTQVLSQLWEDVLSHPNRDIDAIIADRLVPLANRLDNTLKPA